MKNISIIGYGERSKNTVVPALIKSNKFLIKQIITKSSRKLIKINDFYGEKILKTQSIEQIKLLDINYLYIAVPAPEIKKVILNLKNRFDIKNIILLIDTPPIYIKDIFFIRNFNKFKEVIVLEDWPFYRNHQIYIQIINNKQIGNLNKILFFHNGYKYHTLSLLRKLFKIKNFNFIISKKLNSGFSTINIYSKLRLISSILNPRDYNIGRTLLIGSSGSIADYKIKTNSKFDNYFVKYKHDSNYKGIEILKNGFILEEYLLNNPYSFNSEDKLLEIQNKIKKDALFDLICEITNKNFINSYKLEDAIYDYLCFFIVDKFGLFFDFRIPFFRNSILSIIIKVLFL